MADLTRLMLRFARRPTRITTVENTRGPCMGTSEAGERLHWPKPTIERAGHAVVFGSSGCRKTTLLIALVVTALAAARHEPPAERPAYLILDPKADWDLLFDAIAAECPERLADIRYLNPFEQGFAFNLRHLKLGKTPLDIRAQMLAGLTATISTAVGSSPTGAGVRQLDLASHVILGALACDHEHASVTWAYDALTDADGHGLHALAELTRSERARSYLLNAKLGEELRVSTASRLRTAFGASDQLERLTAARSCIQWDDLLAPGRITILNVGQPTGGLTSLQEFYANAVSRPAFDFLLERASPWPGHLCHVISDESQIIAPVLGDIAERLLTTGRSRGISLTTISQGTTLINAASSTLLPVLLSNTPNKLIGRLNASDAELLARDRAPGLGVEESLGAVRSRFIGAVTNLQDGEFFWLRPGQQTRFRSLTVDLKRWRKAGVEHAPAINAAKERLALPPATGRRVTLTDAVPRVAPNRRSRGQNGSPASQSRPSNTTSSNPVLSRRPRSRWG